MRYLRLHTIGFAALLVALTVIHCAPTEAQADRRRRWTTYGSDRGRLVVACDMTSDTCSDGRKITTTRATPVPCEVSPGMWEMVPENTGCYSVRGLESWAQNTSYLSWGAELDRSPWVVMNGSAITKLQDGGYRLCHISETANNSGINQPYSAGLQDGELVTLAVIARPNTASAIHLAPTGSKFGVLQMPSEWWGRYFHAAVYNDGALERVYIYPRPGGQQLCIDLLAAWLTKSDTPGRACWGGEAPVTCAADRHTISTEGWPTEAGEISLVFTVGESTTHQYLIDGRAPGDVSNKTLLLVERLQRRLRLDIVPGSATHGPVLEAGRTYAARLRVAGGRTAVFLDGVKVIDVQGTPNWAAVATLGNRFEQDEPLNGAISSIRVRRFE